MNAFMKKIEDAKGFIFDMDGTLGDTHLFHYLAYKTILEKYGATFSIEDSNSLYAAKSAETIIPFVLKRHDIILSQKKITEIVAEKRTLFKNLIGQKKIHTIPGIKKFLQSIKKAGKKSIVATGNIYENSRIVLDRIGIISFFEEIITNSHVDNPKPAADIFLFAAKKLGLDPAECVIFEDSPHVIEQAKKLHLFCVGVATSSTKKMLKNAGADIIIKDYLDLLQTHN